MQYQFIKENKDHYGVTDLCACFGLSSSAYYAWEGGEPCERFKTDALYKEQIVKLYKEAKGRYGHRPIYEHLQEEGYSCGRDRTLRLMQQLHLRGKRKRCFKPQGTDSKHDFGYHANRLKELGKPERCDQVWVADTTYLQTSSGWSYLATVMDLFSRRIVGWSVSSRNDKELTCEAFRNAVQTRGGAIPSGLIHHSDRGSTYASDQYQRLLNKHKVVPSMSAKGNCYDNAAQESFFGRYKSSNVGSQVFFDESAARSNAFEYIEIFYNRYRKHSSLGYKNPTQFEEIFAPPMGGIHQSLKACNNNN